MSHSSHHDAPRLPDSGEARGIRDTAGEPSYRVRPSLADFRRRAPPPGLDERTRLMHRIAWLDAALTAAQGRLSPRRKRVALSACADILDATGHDDDRQFIAQAIHCLMRKHGLEPDPSADEGPPAH